MTRRYLSGLLLLILTSCAQPVELDLPLTVQPTPGPTNEPPLPTLEPPPKSLIVCLGREPESLYRYGTAYLYGDTAREAEAVLQAIYDGPLDVRQYEYHPVILEKLASLADGDARYEPVSVGEGELYLNPRTLQPELLEIGGHYLPAGCQSDDCVLTYAGGTVRMDQLVVNFRLRSGVRWSDGEPLTADDSLFSFELDRHIDTPTPKTQVDRTASYEVVDPQTIRWTGIPGYKDSEYFSNFWSPLPEHVLGELSPEELLSAEETNFSPIGWGPFVLLEWRPGQDITLSRNPDYFRANEGLPGFDVLQFRFLRGGPQGSIEQLLTRECDVLDESALADALGVEVIDPGALAELAELDAAGGIEIAWTPGAEMERLDFGLAPVFSAGIPDLFADSRTRAAVAACIDRERIVSGTLIGLSEIPVSYLPPAHPAATDDLETIPYGVSDAAALLEEAGWMEEDSDTSTPRTARGVEGVSNGTPLSFTFLTTPDEFHRAVAARLEDDLAGCGIELTTEFLSKADIFEPWPDGPVFGRSFQTVGWAWPSWVSPLCEMYASREIPSDESPLGVNAAGFSLADYDRACSTLLLGRADSQEYSDAVRLTQELFRESLPSIPLYMRPRVLAHSQTVCGVEVDPISFSAFWNIESLDTCP
ncbi:MAG: ABC transporter substrate-binding protein [Anaerolineales bacterium]